MKINQRKIEKLIKLAILNKFVIINKNDITYIISKYNTFFKDSVMDSNWKTIEQIHNTIFFISKRTKKRYFRCVIIENNKSRKSYRYIKRLIIKNVKK